MNLEWPWFIVMNTEKISALELTAYWKALAKPENVGNIAIVPSSRLPPWNEICAELSWRKHRLAGGYFGKESHGYCGVYRLIGLTTEDDPKSPATLNRVLGQDTTGTLYIGKAGRLNERINAMRRPRYSHGAIAALKRTSLLELFPLTKLAIGMLFTDCSMIGWVEKDLLAAYRNAFGDAPPLNYRVDR